MKGESGGLGETQGSFQLLAGNGWLVPMGLTSGFSQFPIVDPDRHTLAFQDAFGLLWEYELCGFGIHTLPPAFAVMVADLLEDLNEDGVNNYFDDILIYSATFDRHLALMERYSPACKGQDIRWSSRSVCGVARVRSM